MEASRKSPESVSCFQRQSLKAHCLHYDITDIVQGSPIGPVVTVLYEPAAKRRRPCSNRLQRGRTHLFTKQAYPPGTFKLSPKINKREKIKNSERLQQSTELTHFFITPVCAHCSTSKHTGKAQKIKCVFSVIQLENLPCAPPGLWSCPS